MPVMNQVRCDIESFIFPGGRFAVGRFVTDRMAIMYSDATTLIRVLLDEHANRLGVRVLARACGLLRFSCGNPKLSRRDADDPLEVRGKMALVREAGAERDLRQAQLTVSPQEVLCSFNAARDHILVRRQPGGRLELAREGVGAEMNHVSHLLQRRTAFDIFPDVLDDSAELSARKNAVRRGWQPVRTRGMTDQVNGQNVGE